MVIKVVSGIKYSLSLYRENGSVGVSSYLLISGCSKHGNNVYSFSERMIRIGSQETPKIPHYLEGHIFDIWERTFPKHFILYFNFNCRLYLIIYVVIMY